VEEQWRSGACAAAAVEHRPVVAVSTLFRRRRRLLLLLRPAVAVSKLAIAFCKTLKYLSLVSWY
jgi:hypothetical protein